MNAMWTKSGKYVIEIVDEIANITSQTSCRAVRSSRPATTSQKRRGRVSARTIGSQARRRGKVDGMAAVTIVAPHLHEVVGPYLKSGNSTRAYQTAADPARATHQPRTGTTTRAIAAAKTVTRAPSERTEAVRP